MSSEREKRYLDLLKCLERIEQRLSVLEGGQTLQRARIDAVVADVGKIERELAGNIMLPRSADEIIVGAKKDRGSPG